MGSKIWIALGVVIVVIVLGAAAMFTFNHYVSKSAAATAQVTCLQGDNTAAAAAQEAQHRADLKSQAELAANLRDAQKAAAIAQRAADAATARAESLSASLDRLKRSDTATKSWADTDIPAALHQSTLQGLQP